jgi:DNA-binding transcriptional regulator YiaG
MSGRHSFSDLKKSLSPGSQVRVKEKVKQLRAEMALNELRKARALSQNELAALLHIKQAALARMENRTDMYISSLRKYIMALGGELDIVARFPDAEVHIQKLHDLH